MEADVKSQKRATTTFNKMNHCQYMFLFIFLLRSHVSKTLTQNVTNGTLGRERYYEEPIAMRRGAEGSLYTQSNGTHGIDFAGFHFEKDNCVVTVQWDRIFESFKTILKEKAEMLDFYEFELKVVGEANNGLEISNFVMVKKSKRGSLKSLPFDIRDLKSIFNFEILDRRIRFVLNSELYEMLQIPLSMTETCFRVRIPDNETSGTPVSDKSVLHPDVQYHITEVLAVIQYTTAMDSPALMDYMMCAKPPSHKYADITLDVEECCTASIPQMPSSALLRLRCHMFQSPRYFLTHMVGICGLTLASFVPLLVQCIPPGRKNTR